MSTAASVNAATCRSTQSQYKEGRLIFGTAPYPTDALPQFSSRRHALTMPRTGLGSDLRTAHYEHRGGTIGAAGQGIDDQLRLARHRHGP